MKIILIFYERDMYLCSSFLALLTMGFSNSTADPDSAEEQTDVSEVVPPGMPHLLLLCRLAIPRDKRRILLLEKKKKMLMCFQV